MNFIKILRNKPIILLIIIVSIIYVDTIFYGYIFDDFWLLKYTLKGIKNEILYGVHMRPVWYLSYYLSNYFFNSSIIDHLINLLLFFVCIIMLYNYTLRYHSRAKSFIILSIWATLPWLTFSVVWIAGRNDLLMIIFVLLSLNSFKNKNNVQTVIYLLLSFMSKINCFLLPIYFLYKSRNNKKQFSFYLLIQISFILISFISYKRGTNERFANLSLLESILNKFVHLFTGIITQVIPFPYFTSKFHFFFYIILLLIGILIFRRVRKDRLKYFLSKSNIDTLILFSIFLAPMMVNSEVRIAIFTSYFLISLLFIEFKSGVNKKLSLIFLLLFLGNNIYTTIVSKRNFYSREYDLNKRYGKYYYGEQRYAINNFYNNTFYIDKKSFLIELKKRVRGD